MKAKIFSACFFLFFIPTIIFSQEKMNTKKWRKTERDSMAKAQLFFDEGLQNMALPIFAKLQNDHPTELYLKYVTAVSAINRSDWHTRSYTFLHDIYLKHKKIHNLEFYLAKASHHAHKFDEAILYLDQFQKNQKKIDPAETKEIPVLRNYIANAKILIPQPRPATITNIGGPVNTYNSEYSPVFNADESVMIFTYVGEKSTGGLQNAYNEPDIYGIYYEDVFTSKKVNGSWSEPEPIVNINTNLNDAAICFSHDGQSLFVFRDDKTNGGDILLSKLIGIEWSVPEPLYGDVNTPSWEGSISLSPNERTIIFASERPGGLGGKDLYISDLQSDGSWGTARNMGDKINTPFDDDAPFYHPDGKTMIYSSKGHNSMGGYDIFRAEMGADSTWTMIENLGYPTNTTDDDIYYVMSADGKRGYYASSKEGGEGMQDIYLVAPAIPGFNPSLVLLSGVTTLKTVNVESEIEITLPGGRSYMTLHSNSESGKYLVTLPGGYDYTIRYKLKTHNDQVKTLELKNLSAYEERVINIDFNKVDSVPVVATNTIVATPTVATTNTVAATNTVTTNTIPDVTSTMTKEGLIFKVQIAAYKVPANYSWKHLEGKGNVEKMILDDGVTRFTIGGEFKTLDEANGYCDNVRGAGQKDAFVTAIYNGKRVYLEELEAKGIIPKRK
jgi:hypothetical protein